MSQRPLFTVLCVAGTVASGVFLSGQQAPAPPWPALVTLDKANAAKLAETGRAGVQVEMPPGVELKLWAPDGLIADPVAVEITPDGTVFVAGTQRNNLPLDIRGHQDWMTVAAMCRANRGLWSRAHSRCGRIACHVPQTSAAPPAVSMRSNHRARS